MPMVVAPAMIHLPPIVPAFTFTGAVPVPEPIAFQRANRHFGPGVVADVHLAVAVRCDAGAAAIRTNENRGTTQMFPQRQYARENVRCALSSRDASKRRSRKLCCCKFIPVSR